MKPKKHLGQNFLIDPLIAEKIVAQLPQGRPVIEIGPGRGIITSPILERKDPYLGIEIDPDLFRLLEKQYTGDNATFLLSDILKTDISALFPGEKINIIGNIPYYITTPIIFHLLKYAEKIGEIVLMVQKEVASRLAATPADKKEYGVLTIMVNFEASVQYLFDIAAAEFRPIPAVDSAIVRIKPRPWPGLQPLDADFFRQTVKKGFQQRRKMLRASLKSLPLEQTETDLTLRPENLTIEEWIRLCNDLTGK